MRTRVLAILNPRAAQDESLREAIGVLRGEGVEIRVRVCWEDGDGRRWAGEAASAGCELVVAAGGDGTLNEAVNGLRDGEGEGPSPALGFLPFGTANDFAGGLGLGRMKPEPGLRRMLEEEPVIVDEGIVDGRRFVNVATGGFGAQVTSRTPSGMKKLLGGAAYLLSALGEFSHLSAHPIAVRGPSWDWEGKAYLVAVGNGRRAGGGFLICPDAEIDDGLLDVVVIPEVPDAELLRMLGGLIRTGGHLESERVWTERGSWIELESEEEIQLNLDGEPEHGRRFRFEIRPRAISLVPPGPVSTTMVGAAGR